MEITEIQNFYKNKIIFITGSTGFVGKALVEKLLRSCSDLSKIILTIRSKQKASVRDRKLEYFNDSLFDSINKSIPEIINKVVFLDANLEEKYFGFNDTDYEFVKSSVNIIFHCAANVDFNAPLKEAINCNVLTTKNIIEFAKNMKHLQAFVHVSTCWVQGYKENTDEAVVNLTYKPDFFLNVFDNNDEELSKMIPSLLKTWPNTYVLTKHIAESLIEKEKENLPVTIFRVPAATATYKEPFPGWVNSIQAISAAGIGLATGTIKVLYIDPEYNIHIVPVDLIVNCMIAVAWNKALQIKSKDLTVYNYSCVTNPITRKKCFDTFTNTPYPLERTIWKPSYVTTNKKWAFDKYVFIYHTVPATISDIILKIFRKKPFFKKNMERNNKLLLEGAYFMTTDFRFQFNNVPALWNSLNRDDQKLFNFDINSIDWDEYLNVCCKSLKFLLEEDLNDLDKCQARRYLLRCKY